MTNPLDRQRAGSYPSTFTLAALPNELRPYDCDHDNELCLCVHDWRINWGNMKKVQKGRNVFVTDSP